MIAALLNNEWALLVRHSETTQVILLEPRASCPQRAEGAQAFENPSPIIFALRAHCGRDARGPSQSLEWFHTDPALFPATLRHQHCSGTICLSIISAAISVA